MRTATFFPLLLCSWGISGVLGWGAAGHEIVATIAQIYLYPSAIPTICSILNYTSRNPDEPQCHLAPIAAWADNIRYRMRWSAPLHYIGAVGDHPSRTCLFPGDKGWAGSKGGNVLTAIRNDTRLLQDWMFQNREGIPSLASDPTANEALKFLVHFLGDMHMPLHLTGRERGGNSVKVLFDDRQTNLHSVWDTLLIAKALRTIPSNYTRPLPSHHVEYNLRDAIYDPLVRRIVWDGILGKWKDEVPTWVSCPPSSSHGQRTTSANDFVGSGLLSPLTFVWQASLRFWNSIRTSGIPDDTDDDVLCPYAWAEPIHDLNCQLIWPKALDEPPYNERSHSYLEFFYHDHHHRKLTPEQELSMIDNEGHFVGGLDDAVAAAPRRGNYLELDTPEYTGVISQDWIIEKLLAQAGIRLAAVLNWLFADTGPEVESRRRRLPDLPVIL